MPVAEWINLALRDRSEVDQKEVEITPAMLEAGVEAAALYDSRDTLDRVVIAVFTAMSRAASLPVVKES